MTGRRKWIWMVLAVSAASVCGFGTAAGAAEATTEYAEDNTYIEDPEELEKDAAEEVPDLDKEKADYVAGLIDAIYVQERTADTDAQCEEAKAAWDALTDEQKALVEGEYADPDYFGRDTGDASQDDPLNEDGIGERELLAVSFGTSYNTSRAEDIGGIEAALQEAFPDWSVRRAFSSQIVINHVQARDGEKIDNMEQALERAVENGVRTLVVQPTHLMQGAEYDEMCSTIDQYRDQFESVEIAEPLLGDVGSSPEEVNPDKEAVMKALAETAAAVSGYGSMEEAAADGMAYVFLGHGTSHTAAVTYHQMQVQADLLGYDNVFIGTVEGKPEETECSAVIEAVSSAGFDKVTIRPLMVVAGDHANNDMAGDDPDSWKTMFENSGLFTAVECQIEGLGRIPEVQEIYSVHAAEAIGE